MTKHVRFYTWRDGRGILMKGILRLFKGSKLGIVVNGRGRTELTRLFCSPCDRLSFRPVQFDTSKLKFDFF